MVEEVKITRMQQRRGSTATWAAYDPVLRLGEVGVDEDLSRMKVGDGVHKWSLRPFADDAGGAGVAQAAAEAARDAAIVAELGAETSASEAMTAAQYATDVSNIATPDALVATLVENNASATAVAIDARIRARKVEIFAASGTWTRASGATRVRVILVGGGGAGASAPSNGRGGGGGAILDITVSAVQFTPVSTVTIGAAGVSATAQAGSTSVTSIGFGTLVAPGGFGGSHATSPGASQRPTIAGVEFETKMPIVGGPGGTSRVSDNPIDFAQGGGAGATPPYAAQRGGGGLVTVAGDIPNGLTGAGGSGRAGHTPGGGGSGGVTGFPGAQGQVCFITYFD